MSISIPTLPLHGSTTIPQLGFGVFQIPPEETAEAVRTALSVGYRHVDTAAAYQNEAAVGEAVRSSGLDREDVFVTTKLWNSEQGREKTRRAFERSLSELDFDYVDLYLIHWPLPSGDKYVETWQTLVDLHEQDGRAHAIGVSNFQISHLERIIAETGVVPAVNQIELHPLLAQEELRAFHDEHGIRTEAWSPIGQGAALEPSAVTELAQELGRTPAQIVLRWHIELGNIVIPKSVTPSRIEENFDVFSFELGPERMARLAELDNGQRTGPDPDEFDVS
jgi:2,5-diketo-D-gluconate reductase A